ncbi:MAG TPA: hypothetical protein VF834_14595 [Streptosporangiaceae bacterium]
MRRTSELVKASRAPTVEPQSPLVGTTHTGLGTARTGTANLGPEKQLAKNKPKRSSELICRQE